MKNLIFLVSVSLLLFSCDMGTNKVTESESGSEMSGTFSLDGDNFNAEFSQVVNELSGQGTASGPTFWQRAGKLPYVLSEFYGHPVEMKNNPDAGNDYRLTIEWNKETSLDKIKGKISDKLKTTLNYTIDSETRMETQYVLSFNDSHKPEKTEKPDFDTEGAVSSTVIEGDNWKIYGSLDKLAEVLSNKTGESILPEKGAGSEAYYYEVNASQGVKGIVQQLKNKYGLAVQVKSVPVEHYILDFM